MAEDETLLVEGSNGGTNNAEDPVSPPEESRASTAPTPAAPVAKTPSIQQVTKLRDANAKYKSLLKLAKERIQAQEEELEQLRAETKRLEALVASANSNNNHSNVDASATLEAEVESSSANVVRVVQCLEDEDDIVWALMEYDASNPDTAMMDGTTSTPPKNRYYKKWKKFKSRFALEDYLRRDTGEPIVVPPYSLSPSQSAAIQEAAKKSVSAITEEFRRFRVKSEIAKKQADAQIKDLHAQSIESTQRRIEGGTQQQRQKSQKQPQRKSDQQKHFERLQRELEEQESRWKEAYNVLLAENKALKSSKSEALLAAQWRQRYETALTEKQKAESRLEMELERNAEMDSERKKASDATKYEAKYRDLKESFRLYRSKAKEIFDAQQRGDVSSPHLLKLSQHASDDAKLDYLKNLMVQYLTSSDADVREPMERAIGTVLKFSQEDLQRIQQRKAQEEGWFGISVG